MAQSRYQWHTIAQAFEQICRGQTPWVAIGNFLNDWWVYAVENRQKLIETPLPPAPNAQMQQWAAFCAAMVEWLCQQEGLSFPSWTSKRHYILHDPWFFYEGVDSRSWMLATTPAPFKMRNIFGGDRMLLKKESSL